MENRADFSHRIPSFPNLSYLSPVHLFLLFLVAQNVEKYSLSKVNFIHI